MNFKYSAFIENSKEAREWLEGIGYDPCPCVGDDTQDLILTDHERGKFHGYDKETYGDILAEREDIGGDEVDCRGNMQLFKAITAVRDDSDYMQWFTDGIHWEVCPSVVADLAGWKRYYQRSGEKYIEPWKATKDELINHFKK